jgi:cytochrome c oxidase subunit 2
MPVKNRFFISSTLGALLLVGAGCAAKTSPLEASDSGAAVNAETARPVETAPGQTVDKVDSDVHVIKITANQFNFAPSEIRVKLGEKVRLEIASVDVDHGFALPAFNLNATLKSKTATTLDFTADKKGSFPFSCSVFCGSGHSGMRGTLIVE